jgi:hypothetical protein
MELVQLFGDVDDFCGEFEKFFNSQALPDKKRKRNRKFKLSLSELEIKDTSLVTYSRNFLTRDFS